MARKRKPRTRRKKQPISVLNMAESALIGNALTMGFFDAGLVDFFTGRMDGQFKAGGDGGQRLTLPEILGFAGSGGFGGTYAASGKGIQSMTDAVKYNLKGEKGVKMIISVAAIPIAFKLTKKLARRPLNAANRGIKRLGVSEVKL